MADSARGQTRRKSAFKFLGSLLTELLYCTLKTLWITLVSIVKTFVPVQKKDVRNEVVLVTGAGSGIGRLMSLRFAELGATVRITATLVEKLIVCAVSVHTCTDFPTLQDFYEGDIGSPTTFRTHAHALTSSSLNSGAKA